MPNEIGDLVSNDLPEDPLTSGRRVAGWFPGGEPVEGKVKELHHGRRFVTYGSMIALWVVIGTIIVRWIIDPTTDLQSIAQTVLLPLVAFVGPIVGFYFKEVS